MTSNARDRRLTALRASERVLSGKRPQTVREQLDRLATLDGLDELPDSYGEFGAIARLEQRVAELLGTEAAVWFPSGTMAQQVALRFGAELTGRDAVALHPMSHLERWERQAYSQLTGLRALWPTAAPRPYTAEELAGLGQPYGTAVVELPLRDAGFLLPSWDELVAVVEAARAAGARVHFDGARLWESAPHFGRPLPELAGLADSVYVSVYKALGSSHGALLAGNAALDGYARSWRHRHGGQLWTNWAAALAALDGLATELPRIPGYVRHAKLVATALAELPGARINPAPPQTESFQLYLPHPAEALSAANLELAETERTWFATGWTDALPGLAMAEIRVGADALEWTAEDVLAAGLRLLELVAKQR
ncbi:threonine aldolase family protein [Kitasatospora viridis]|uniref:L-threonine aldolase n=1 Tax=Kitasatospora viridis TaxID=281105 RepID=A0A561ULP8_9ACTN|nr:beta-eliminating lyase-related protein [Kitasatospora viridis]TWG00254.1 L-threonine aldolase [Kitasatospora viridis]